MLLRELAVLQMHVRMLVVGLVVGLEVVRAWMRKLVRRRELMLLLVIVVLRLGLLLRCLVLREMLHPAVLWLVVLLRWRLMMRLRKLRQALHRLRL